MRTTLLVFYCCLLTPLNRLPAQAPDTVFSPKAAPSFTETDARPPASVNRYDIEVPKKRPILREKPTQPYQNSYEFTAEHDWFSPTIPVWSVILDEFKGVPELNYLEIGCHEGRSSVWMLENILTHVTSRLTCIDPFLEHFGGEISKQRFNSNVRKAGGANRFNVIVGLSQIELRTLPLESFDVIYVDGDHWAAPVLEDAVLSWRLLKPGGLLIFDDYAWQHDREPPLRPLMALDFFTEVFRPHAEVVHRDYQLILRKKR